MDDLHLKRVNRQIRSYKAFLTGLNRRQVFERRGRLPVLKKFIRSFYGRGTRAISRKEKICKYYEDDFKLAHVLNPAQEAKLKSYFVSLTKNFWHKQGSRGYSLGRYLKTLKSPPSLTEIGCFEYGRLLGRNSTFGDTELFSKLPDHLLPLALWGYFIQLFVELTNDVCLPFILSKICMELNDFHNSFYLLRVAWGRVRSPTKGDFVHFYASAVISKKEDAWMKYICEKFDCCETDVGEKFGVGEEFGVCKTTVGEKSDFCKTNICQKDVHTNIVKLLSAINKKGAVKFAGYFLLSILESKRDVCESLARQIPQILEKLLIHVSRNLFACKRRNCCCKKVLLNKRDLLGFLKEDHLQAAFLISKLLTLREIKVQDAALLVRLKGLKFNIGRLLEIFSRLNSAETVRLYLQENCEHLAVRLAEEMVEQYYSLKSHSSEEKLVSLKELKQAAGLSGKSYENTCGQSYENCTQSPCRLLETPKKAVYQNFTPGEFMMIVPVSPLPETCALDEILY